MKKNYIDEEIDNIVNDFLISEGYFGDLKNRAVNNLKSRVKNGLEGFDVGGNYQRTADMYGDMDFDEMINMFDQAINFFNEYSIYFSKCKGGNEDMENIQEDLRYLIDYTSQMKKIYKGDFSFLNVNEGVGNRLKGFYNGFKNNRNYQRDIQTRAISINEYIVLNLFPKLRGAYHSIIVSINNLLKVYKSFETFCENLKKFRVGLDYMINYIQKNLYQEREKHSKLTDKGYELGRNIQKIPSKVNKGFKKLADYGDELDPLVVNSQEEQVPNKLQQFGKNIYHKVGRKLRDIFGDENINNFEQGYKNLISDENGEI